MIIFIPYYNIILHYLYIIFLKKFLSIPGLLLLLERN
jgi:hypothetical protein